ncbi:hypothetical protein ACFFNY_17740 [Paenibacillus hodogayensis]|uniref:Arginine dihydrolase ArgZ/ArgE-like C-terminal second subdomain domain-containing protein n=1 Tax=Paenibacillus hodogayensis TaxID=279208 RepID=A0ABV5VZJ8_9BACL
MVNGERLSFAGIKTNTVYERTNLVTIRNMARPYEAGAEAWCGADSEPFGRLIDSIVAARLEGKPVIWSMGAHVIKNGMSRYVIEMVRHGFLTHVSGNGATSIHDFELAFLGETSEDVARSIEDGSFGMWEETGRYMNEAIQQGAALGLGYGPSLYRYLSAHPEKFPHYDDCVFVQCQRYGVPYTCHISIGTDIIHQHPIVDFEALGAASGEDFRTMCRSVAAMRDGGVFLNFGSAISGPELFLRSLALSRNRGLPMEGIVAANFDIVPTQAAFKPPATDPDYHYRPRRVLVDRLSEIGGEAHLFHGLHQQTIPALFHRLLQRKEELGAQFQGAAAANNTEPGMAGAGRNDREPGMVGAGRNDREPGMTGAVANDREPGMGGAVANDREPGMTGAVANDREPGMGGAVANDREPGMTGAVANDRELGMTGAVANDREPGMTGAVANDREPGMTGAVANDQVPGMTGAASFPLYPAKLYPVGSRRNGLYLTQPALSGSGGTLSTGTFSGSINPIGLTSASAPKRAVGSQSSSAPGNTLGLEDAAGLENTSVPGDYSGLEEAAGLGNTAVPEDSSGLEEAAGLGNTAVPGDSSVLEDAVSLGNVVTVAADAFRVAAVPGSGESPAGWSAPQFDDFIKRMREAKQNGSRILVSLGSHVIGSGAHRYLIEWIREGYVSHLAMTGATAFQDIELAAFGYTEALEEGTLASGTLAMWQETGDIVHQALADGCVNDFGYGESLADYARRHPKRFPHLADSLLGACMRASIPYTCHITIGTDDIQLHPQADFGIQGGASGLDFQSYCHTVANLEGGMFLNFGSTVTGPEVFLKALSISRNLQYPVHHITTANFDIVRLGDYHKKVGYEDWDYYYRPRKNIVHRPTSLGGKGYHFEGLHEETIPAIWQALLGNAKSGMS